MGLFSKKRTVEISVRGMTCGGCEGKVKRALEARPDVKMATPDRENDRVTITVKGDADTVQFRQVCINLGFEA